MTAVPIVNANLVTVALESLLYGVFLVLAATSMYLHLARAGSQRSSYGSMSAAFFTPVILGSSLVICTVTGHWIMTVVRLFDAFVNWEGGTMPILYYSDLALTTEVVKTAFLIATLITSDVLFIYRLWTVWGYNYYVIILPTCTVLGLCVAGPGVCYQLSRVASGETVFVKQLARWISADYAFTFATNVYSSSGIAWRVWRARKHASAYGGGNLMRVLATIVESAAFYTSYTIFFFAAYESNNNIQYTAVDTLCPVAGIAFMMINVRVALGWAQQAHPSSSSSGAVISRRGAEQSFAMRPVAVDITRVVHKEDDMGQPIKSDYSSEV
ncbi:uncharacterized protein LAESUDRAFT_673837 [Laetiporus sulphureus 93-53]|uniref:Uncharacterized protein n=1 Tax=Laetiporus sulphureus 93-53 TaxID=1314785 RepID=A0A165GAM7_9APHY|nr:uncharacterized protein LAESUDRAFT_673837 [Laetiporus sulphureus 93-53]KZT10077.1 hypothetical protein LAESUDRAFT_673837 [Laetiporus sulphureus 93-53]